MLRCPSFSGGIRSPVQNPSGVNCMNSLEIAVVVCDCDRLRRIQPVALFGIVIVDLQVGRIAHKVQSANGKTFDLQPGALFQIGLPFRAAIGADEFDLLVHNTK